eukprot:213296-Hanusia_phi.AAC.1
MSDPTRTAVTELPRFTSPSTRSRTVRYPGGPQPVSRWQAALRGAAAGRPPGRPAVSLSGSRRP